MENRSMAPKQALSPNPKPKTRASFSVLSSPRRALSAHPGLFLAILIYLFLSLSYFFIVPIFEGPDEWTHTGHVKYIAEGNGLPVMLPGQGIWGGQQPPLYYALGALLVQPFELDGVQDYETNRRNPHASIGYALDPGNKNNYLHQPSESFPYQGLALTVHLLRLYSMSFALISLVFAYLTAFEFMSATANVKQAKGFATIVALFMACHPMFAFITASVANEPANIAFSAIGLWLAQRYVLNGPSRSWQRAVALGVTLGLISLSKMTGLSFGLVAVVAVLILTISTRKQPGAAHLLWRDGLIIGALFLAVGGWWYWRNYRLYGDFFQEGLYQIYFNDTPDPITLSDFLYTLSTGEVSFWAAFGWLNIAAPDWVYSLYRVISRIGLVGVALAIVVHLGQLIRQWVTPTDQSPPEPRSSTKPLSNPNLASRFALSVSHYNPALFLHLIFPATLAFTLTRLVAIEGGLQGRQLLPALPSIAIVIIWGWWVLVPDRARMALLTILLALLFGVAAWLPYGVVAPEYFPPPLLTEAELPHALPRLDWTYGEGEIKLIGVEIGAELVHPGQRVPVTAYWQLLKPIETDYSVFVHLIGRDYTNVGQLNTYPGLGLRPTSTLRPGQIVVDTYPVQVNGGSKSPTRLLVNLGLFNFDEPGRPGIIPTTPTGSPPASPTAGQLKLIPWEWPPYEKDRPPVAEFADQIWMQTYSIHNCENRDDRCQISLSWLAQGRPSTDYTVFIQLWRDGAFVTGFDSPPLANDYPSSLWEAGELIIDPHPLDLTTLPPGDYELLAGLYNFTTGERLPASSQGQSLPDFAVNLGTIHLK